MRRDAKLIVLGLAGAAAFGLGACSGNNATNTTVSSAASDHGAARESGASNSSMTANPGAPQNSGAAPGASQPPS